MRKLLIITIALVMLLTACSTPSQSTTPSQSPSPTPSQSSTEENNEVKTATVQTITGSEAHEIIESDEEYTLVDVRTTEEYAEGHIEGAILIPDTDIAKLSESLLPDKDAKILIYCRSGKRSSGAAKVLAELGYTDVYDFGGIIDWKYEVVK